jgi:hypothetical protein
LLSSGQVMQAIQLAGANAAQAAARAAGDME